MPNLTSHRPLIAHVRQPSRLSYTSLQSCPFCVQPISVLGAWYIYSRLFPRLDLKRPSLSTASKQPNVILPVSKSISLLAVTWPSVRGEGGDEERWTDSWILWRPQNKQANTFNLKNRPVKVWLLKTFPNTSFSNFNANF